MKSNVSVFWFRRDLRWEDNVGLYQALSSGIPILPIFIFDPTIINKLEDKKDRRVDYIHQAISTINTELRVFTARLNTFNGNPLDVFKMLSEKYAVQGVFCSRDYEPQAIKRDTQICQFFNERSVPCKAFKDHVIFDKKMY